MFGRSKRKKQQAEETLAAQAATQDAQAAAQTQLEQQATLTTQEEPDEDFLEKNEGVLRELSEEEREKFGDLKVDLESMISALKEIGYSDEEIAEMIPQPLTLSETVDLCEEMDKLYREAKYAEVLDRGLEYYYNNQLEEGNFADQICFMLSMSAIQSKDAKNTAELAEFAPVVFINRMGLEDPGVPPVVISIVEQGEEVVPGCMRSAALKIYPLFCDFFGEEHEHSLKMEAFTQ